MNTFFKKIKNTPNSISDFFKINPHRHWAILLYIFFILVSILILFSFYLLYQIKNENIFQVKAGQTENHVLLNDDLLKKTMEFYDQKSINKNYIEKNPSIHKDPSI